jgi:hypothetical protein
VVVAVVLLRKERDLKAVHWYFPGWFASQAGPDHGARAGRSRTGTAKSAEASARRMRCRCRVASQPQYLLWRA